MYFVYIILCKNKAYYTGMTNNVEERVLRHKKGSGAHYTKVFGVKKLVYTEGVENRSLALKREHQIKKLSRKEKQKLVWSWNT